MLLLLFMVHNIRIRELGKQMAVFSEYKVGLA